LPQKEKKSVTLKFKDDSAPRTLVIVLKRTEFEYKEIFFQIKVRSDINT